MLIRTRKHLTLTTLLSGLLLVSSAHAETKGAKTGGVAEIEIESVNTKSTVKAAVPAKTNTPIPAQKVEAKIPTSTPVPTEPIPTNTPKPVPTNTPVPTKTAPQAPTSTPTVLVKILIKATPTPTPMADDKGSQFSFSIDALGQSLFRANTTNVSLGVGGQVFADWRPIQYVSLGLGGQYSYFPGSTSFSLGSFDLGGRIFPVPVPDNPTGEFYLQGGLGLNLTLEPAHVGHYHGYAGLGYRLFLSQNMALDTGAQYDFYSPIGNPTNGIGAKVGLTFLFGRTKWPGPSDITSEEGTNVTARGGYIKGSPFYKWQAGDSLKGVSAKVFGDPLLFSFLVDTNRDLFQHPAQIRVGTEVRVSALSFDPDQLDAYRDKSLHDPFYTRLERVSKKFGYQTDPHWKGPSRYLWKRHDTLTSVAEKIYGDEDLYPILVDANEKRLILPANLKPGSFLVVPPPPIGDWLEVVHNWAWVKDPYTWWKNVTQDNMDQRSKTKE